MLSMNVRMDEDTPGIKNRRLNKKKRLRTALHQMYSRLRKWGGVERWWEGASGRGALREGDKRVMVTLIFAGPLFLTLE